MFVILYLQDDKIFVSLAFFPGNSTLRILTWTNAESKTTIHQQIHRQLKWENHIWDQQISDSRSINQWNSSRSKGKCNSQASKTARRYTLGHQYPLSQRYTYLQDKLQKYQRHPQRRYLSQNRTTPQTKRTTYRQHHQTRSRYHHHDRFIKMPTLSRLQYPNQRCLRQCQRYRDQNLREGSR